MQTATKPDSVIETVAPPDALTVGSIGILAYMLGNVLHEGVGHGGACLLVGAQPLVLSSVHFECSMDSRLVMAGGTVMNLLAGAVFFALGRLTGRGYPRLRYFFWLSMTVNLFTGTGYFLFSGIGGIGDWGAFIQGLGPQWLWRIGLTIFGAATYLLAARISLLELRPLIGSNKEQRYQRAVRLSTIPYFAGGILMCIAGALNPKGMVLIQLRICGVTRNGLLLVNVPPGVLTVTKPVVAKIGNGCSQVSGGRNLQGRPVSARTRHFGRDDPALPRLQEGGPLLVVENDVEE